MKLFVTVRTPIVVKKKRAYFFFQVLEENSKILNLPIMEIISTQILGLHSMKMKLCIQILALPII